MAMTFAYSDAEEAPPIDMLHTLFELEQWSCELINDDEIISTIKGRWTDYSLQANWHDSDNLLQLAICTQFILRKDKWQDCCALLALINPQMKMGHFSIWPQIAFKQKPDEYAIIYRQGLILGSDKLMELGNTEMIVKQAISECDRFFPALQFLINHDLSPEEALKSALVNIDGEA